MFKNHFTISWRNIVRNKVYSLLNIVGFSLALCTCAALYTVINYELTFDSFHPDKKRIYRVMADFRESTGDTLHFSRVPAQLANYGRSQISGIEKIAELIPFNANIKIALPHQPDREFSSVIDDSHFVTTVFAESEYFDIFKYEWLAGNDKAALSAPLSVVLTQSRANEYFGSRPPDKFLGRQITYQDSLLATVTGIIKDWDGNTDLGYTDFLSYPSQGNSFFSTSVSPIAWKPTNVSAQVFIKLMAGTQPDEINQSFDRLLKVSSGQTEATRLWLEPISKMHFNSDIIENPIRTAHLPTLFSLMAIAIFILILAIVNFINLSTAQSIRRSKEIGLRKVLGSDKLSLINQFLTETFILTLLSVVITLLLVNPILTLFGSFIPKGINFQLFSSSSLIFIFVITAITTLLAGIYPAKLVSNRLPSLNLSGGNDIRIGGSDLRKGLLVFQFTVSLVFIMASFVIWEQLKYTREKDLGFNSDAILNIDTPRGQGYDKVALLAQNIRKIPGIEIVSLEWLAPMTDNARGMKLKIEKDDVKDFWVVQVAGDENYIPLYNINLMAGRNLVKADSVQEFVINESLSKFIGSKNPHESLGEVLYWNDRPYPIVGVVADFHTGSLHEKVEPLCIINRPDRESSLAIKLSSKNEKFSTMNGVLMKIEKEWDQLYPSQAFNYKWFDDSLGLLYEKDRKTATLINTAMVMAILISCIGLFGLGMYMAERRRKEIGIRKVLGASLFGIVSMILNDFGKLIIISLVIASPIAWYIMGKWLQNFAYSASIEWFAVFAASGIAIALITFLTVSMQALKVANTNPIKSLRTE